MSFFSVDVSIPPLPPVHLPPVPEVIDVPADLPALEPDVVISFPLNEQLMDMVVVPDEHDGQDVIYVAVSQERVNIWAALVYFNPEITLGVMVLVVLVVLRKLWVTRRFTHRKGEPYCKKCWAGLTGVASDTCPECGRAIKKTRRTARWSKRSLGHARWRWAFAALFLTLGTTTLWFGEAWHALYKHGFAPEKPADWWALLDPVDRESPIRINRAARWLGWYSDTLAMHARENDAAWIEMLLWEYEGDEGVRYRLQIQRYATDDGRMLSCDPFPATSSYQDQSSDNSSRLELIRLGGVILVSDFDEYYRYRYDTDEPWMLYGEADPDIRHEIVALTADGLHLVFAQYDTSGNIGLFSSGSDLQVVVYDTETGDQCSLLLTASGGPRIDGGDPEVRAISPSGTPAWEVDFATNTVVPLDDGNILLVGSMSLAVWELNTGEIVDVPKDTQVVKAIRDDLWVDLEFDPHPVRAGYPFPSGSAFKRHRVSSQRLGRSWMLEGYQDYNRQYDYEYEWAEVLDGLYNWQEDIFLYALTGDTTSQHPSRAIRLNHKSGVSLQDLRGLSPSGEWLAVDMVSWLSGDSSRPVLSPVLVLIDLETDAVVGRLDFESNSDLQSVFVNDGDHFLAGGWREITGASEYSRSRRDEIHLYNLPAVDDR